MSFQLPARASVPFATGGGEDPLLVEGSAHFRQPTQRTPIKKLLVIGAQGYKGERRRYVLGYQKQPQTLCTGFDPDSNSKKEWRGHPRWVVEKDANQREK